MYSLFSFKSARVMCSVGSIVIIFSGWVAKLGPVRRQKSVKQVSFRHFQSPSLACFDVLAIAREPPVVNSFVKIIFSARASAIVMPAAPTAPPRRHARKPLILLCAAPSAFKPNENLRIW
jgi:hypothetical protein